MSFRSEALELAKLNPKFGFLPLNSNKRPIFAWKNDHPDGFTIEECLEHHNCQAIGVLLGTQLICIDFDGESAVNYAGFRNIDLLHKTWTIKRNSYKGFFRYKVLYQPTIQQIEELPFGEFQKSHITKNAGEDDKREALEVFATHPRYAVVLGRHPSGDSYYSPEGYGFADLTSPPKETWDLVLDFANRTEEPLQTKKSLTRGDWEKIKDVCPVCGRNRQHFCSMSKDRNTIRCFHGVTYHPPILKKGELTPDGFWAFSSTSKTRTGETFSNFVRHTEKLITKQQIYKRQMERNYE